MLRLSSVSCVLGSSILLASACADDGGGSGDEVGSTSTSDSSTTLGESGTLGESSEGPTTLDGGSTDDASDMSTSSDDQADGQDNGQDNGVKFDLSEWNDEPPFDTDGNFGPGSCRSSEIYGAAGGFPAFEDPNYADFLDRSVAIVTHSNYDPAPNNFSLTVVDISGPPPPPNLNYLAPLYHHPSWTITNLGRHFGITLDSAGNIYLAATTVWGARPNPGEIKRIDGVTGEISVLVTLPNNGPALGNLNYDCVSETIYVANHEDGRIYQVNLDGEIESTYQHSTGDITLGPPADPGEPNGQFWPLGQRPWAIQSHAGRLYYSIWGSSGANSVWSVAYVDEDGVPDPMTAKKEFDTPGSMPVSDLGFAHDGWMLISQRTMLGDMQTSAHQSKTYDYQYQNGQWVLQGTNYLLGEIASGNNATGGVDHDFVENGYVWMTGDALDFYTPDCVYGLQGTPYGGGSIENSTLIDLDHEVSGQDKTVYGDVELPIPGDVTPVPPPAG